MQSSKKDANKKSVIQLVISFLTAALTAISTTSCMGNSPILYVTIKPCKENLIGFFLCCSYSSLLACSSSLPYILQ